MMIWTARLTRKKAAAGVILAGAALCALLLWLGRPEEVPVDLSTNEARIAYLAELGWQVSSEPVETLQLVLPDPLQEPYLSYNELQLSQGFDLSLCCGKQVERCTYQVTNYPQRSEDIQVNLYICEGQIVAGDISCLGEDGFRVVLAYPESDS